MYHLFPTLSRFDKTAIFVTDVLVSRVYTNTDTNQN
jgi:hypothetical protein